MASGGAIKGIPLHWGLAETVGKYSICRMMKCVYALDSYSTYSTVFHAVFVDCTTVFMNRHLMHLFL